MKKWKLPAPPVFPEDEEKSSRALALYQVQVTLFALALAALPVSIFNASLRLILLTLTLSILFVLVLSYTIARRGYISLASYLTIGTVIAGIIFLDYTGRGETRPLLIFSIVPIFISGLLLGFRATLATAILMGIAHGLLVYADTLDLYPFPRTTIPSLQNMVVRGWGISAQQRSCNLPCGAFRSCCNVQKRMNKRFVRATRCSKKPNAT